MKNWKLKTLTQEIRGSQISLAQQFAFFLDTCTHGSDGMLHPCNRINFSASETDARLEDRIRHVGVACCSVRA